MASMFENPEALAKLAALYPKPAQTAASSHARKEGGRTTKGSGAKITDAAKQTLRDRGVELR